MGVAGARIALEGDPVSSLPEPARSSQQKLLFNSLLVVKLLQLNRPRWEYLHQRNRQTIQRASQSVGDGRICVEQ